MLSLVLIFVFYLVLPIYLCFVYHHYRKKKKFCSNFANENGIKIGGANKLVLNLGNIRKYFQLYLSLGMKLVKFHKMIKFN